MFLLSKGQAIYSSCTIFEHPQNIARILQQIACFELWNVLIFNKFQNKGVKPLLILRQVLLSFLVNVGGKHTHNSGKK